MGIDLGLAAVDGYARADDARVLRDQQREKFSWDKQRADSELALLPEKQAAQKSGYQVQSAQNDSALALAPNNAKIAKALSDQTLEDLPRHIAEQRRQGVFNDADAQTAGVAKLADLISLGDPAQITSFLNGWRKTNPSSMGADVARVGFTKDEKTGENMFVAQDAQGNPVMQMSASQIQRAKDSVGKTDLKVLKPGDSLVGVKGGKATNLTTAPVNPALIKGLGAAHVPANVQAAEWIMANKGNPEAMAAYKQVTESRGGKAQFVSNLLGKGLMGNETPQKIQEMKDLYSGLYDQINRDYSEGGGQSNSPGAPTIDPRISTLIGLPSP